MADRRTALRQTVEQAPDHAPGAAGTIGGPPIAGTPMTRMEAEIVDGNPRILVVDQPRPAVDPRVGGPAPQAGKVVALRFQSPVVAWADKLPVHAATAGSARRRGAVEN